MVNRNHSSNIISINSMVEELEHKYEVEIKKTEERQKIPDKVKEVLKESGMMDEK